jgi:pyruvate, water dikinase
MAVPAAVAAAAVRPLRGVGAFDAPEVGGKAARLGELVAAGFRVPAGLVLPVRAYLDAMAAAGVRARLAGIHRRALDATDERALAALSAEAAGIVRAAAPPADLLAGLRSGYGSLPDPTGRGAVVAVRSSAVGGDDDEALTGCFVTTTNVRGPDEVADAVLACWASVFDPRAVAHRAARGDRGEPALAVVVQVMVPAQRSGVVFTDDPVTGDPDVVLVEAVHGQGAVLASSAVEPDSYRFRGRLARLASLRVGHQTHQVVRGRDGHDLTVALDPERADGRVLDDAEARAVALLALAVRRRFGEPQVIGWAMAARQLWLLHCRAMAQGGDR